MPDPSKRYSPHVFLILSLSGALALARLDSCLQDYASRRVRADNALAQLEILTEKVNGAEWETLHEKKISPTNRLLLDSLDRTANEIKLPLDALRNDLPSVIPLERDLASYLRQVHAEFRLLDAGELARARELDESHVDPQYAQLVRAIRRTDGDIHREVRRATGGASTGSTLVLIAFAIGTSLLFGRIERARRSTALVLAEQTLLQKREEYFRTLIRNASDVILVAEAGGAIRYVSPAAVATLGRDPETLVGIDVFSLVHPDDRAHAQTIFFEATTRLSSLRNEWRMRHEDGAWRSLEVVVTNLLNDSGISGVLMTFRDVTERKRFEEELAHRAFHDTLTGLPNRVLFADRVNQALVRARRNQSLLAVAFVDLDNFKIVNDSLGHEAGDQLLRFVADRLKEAARPEDTIARLGGDEFTLLLEDLRSVDDAKRVIEELLIYLRRPVSLAGREVFATASVGIAVSAAGAGDSDALLRDADTAMYQVKANGKSDYVVFDRGMNAAAMERMELEMDLRRAIDRDEFQLHYQPIVDLQTGRVVGVEALVRWNHPTRGLIPPIKFISIAEETGLILPLGLWVLEEACRQMAGWNRAYSSAPPMIVSVNLSGRQLQAASIVDEIVAILEKTGLSPKSLKIEVTESILMLNSDEAIARLRRLRAMGIRIAIDDFGTGYSSMAYLTGLPIDTLKIDRSFIAKIGETEESEAIVRAIVSLAKALNLKVTSEGIESADQLAHLKEMGCDQGQGFFLGRPLTGTALEALLATKNQEKSGRRRAA